MAANMRLFRPFSTLINFSVTNKCYAAKQLSSRKISLSKHSFYTKQDTITTNSSVVKSRNICTVGLPPGQRTSFLKGSSFLSHFSLPLPLTSLNVFNTNVRFITLLTRFNIVDNSTLSQRSRRYKKPYLIGYDRKCKTADIGDVIRVAVRGKVHKALIVTTRKPKAHTIPRYDNNNIVLVDDSFAPVGTRIKCPLPTMLRARKDKFSKVLALATRFV